MKVTRAPFDTHYEAIIGIAARRFRERGINAVTLLDVMREVGLTHGAFYGHFPSRRNRGQRLRVCVDEHRSLLESVVEGLGRRGLDAVARGISTRATSAD